MCEESARNIDGSEDEVCRRIFSDNELRKSTSSYHSPLGMSNRGKEVVHEVLDEKVGARMD